MECVHPVETSRLRSRARFFGLETPVADLVFGTGMSVDGITLAYGIVTLAHADADPEYTAAAAGFNPLIVAHMLKWRCDISDDYAQLATEDEAEREVQRERERLRCLGLRFLGMPLLDCGADMARSEFILSAIVEADRSIFEGVSHYSAFCDLCTALTSFGCVHSRVEAA